MWSIGSPELARKGRNEAGAMKWPAGTAQVKVVKINQRVGSAELACQSHSLVNSSAEVIGWCGSCASGLKASGGSAEVEFQIPAS